MQLRASQSVLEVSFNQSRASQGSQAKLGCKMALQQGAPIHLRSNRREQNEKSARFSIEKDHLSRGRAELVRRDDFGQLLTQPSRQIGSFPIVAAILEESLCVLGRALFIEGLHHENAEIKKLRAKRIAVVCFEEPDAFGSRAQSRAIAFERSTSHHAIQLDESRVELSDRAEVEERQSVRRLRAFISNDQEVSEVRIGLHAPPREDLVEIELQRGFRNGVAGLLRQ